MFAWMRRLWARLKLLYLLRIDPAQGLMRVHGDRVVLAPATVLDATRQRVAQIGPAGRRFLYEAGYDAGKEYGTTVQEVFGGFDTPEQFTQVNETFARLSGWGTLDVVEEDYDANEYRIVVTNNIFTPLDADDKTCEYTAGMLAGTATIVVGTPMAGREVACQNAGDDRCVFELREEDAFDSDFPWDSE